MSQFPFDGVVFDVDGVLFDAEKLSWNNWAEVGRQMAAEARARRHEEMFLCLSDGEKAQLLALLEKLSADWAERYGGEGEHPRHGGRHGRRGG